METALLVGFIILFVISLASGCLIYSHYIYSRNRLFSKTKYSVLWITICALVVIITLVAGILFIVQKDTPEPIKHGDVCCGLSFASCAVVSSYLVFLCLAPTLTNKNKIQYEDILKIDYQPKINALLMKIGDVEQLKSAISKKSKSYYHDMLSYYENILKRAKDQKISRVEKLADIVTFNDAFTHKWCTFTNNLQLLLTYQYCMALEKIS